MSVSDYLTLLYCDLCIYVDCLFTLTGTIDANEAFTISLVSLSRSNDSDTNNAENAAEGNSLSTIASFHPKFTYPLFGDDERIFGYKGLKVNLQFNASDLRPNLSISYTKKLTSVSGMEVTDITSVMKEYLPAGQLPYLIQSYILLGYVTRTIVSPGLGFFLLTCFHSRLPENCRLPASYQINSRHLGAPRTARQDLQQGRGILRSLESQPGRPGR